jgi:hypothetical protein
VKKLGGSLISLAFGGALLTSCGGHEMQSGSTVLPQAVAPATKPKCGENDGVKITPCPITIVGATSKDVTVSGPGVVDSRYGEGDCYPYACKVKQISDVVWQVTGYRCKTTLQKKKEYFLAAISIYGTNESGGILGFGTLGVKFVLKRCKKG